MPSEFELIARFFARPCDAEPGVVAGPGDDCALLAPSAGSELAVSVDTSVVDVHFPQAAPAVAIGHRALAVALSDLAAMGARARWCALAATLPEADEAWLESFAAGFHALCRRSRVALVGGDVTRGPLSLSVTVHGEVPAGRALRRSGAEAGDILAVTGALGGGRGGLAAWRDGVRDLDDPLLRAYLLPEPRLTAGEVLRELAHAAIDISDGLLADLQHLCTASGVGAALQPEVLPLAEGLTARLGEAAAREAALAGGDDYELLVALPPEALNEAVNRLQTLGLPLTPIGRVVGEPGIHGIDDSTRPTGWQHFPGGTP
ncbi:thiamine-phosphate kinase [Modicisalibacter sp. 'Wilcox']|uniref:thiamine-phosphate kinase n=1 Tax=Modicisalibacter sp. 'Wilcox' TaxID=2679914 RepID=UPI0013D34504|nr:thiamine-phosphate kinase [Modicisalibacter sp. 'Wilcox']